MGHGVPHDQFDLLRREAPVHWHEHPEYTGFWAVTRHADVRQVSRDHHTFSAELGSTFIRDHDEESLEMVRMTLLNMDPPKHSRYRRLVSAGFTPRMVERIIDHIQERAVAHPRRDQGPSRDRLRRRGRRRASAAGHLRDDRRARRRPSPIFDWSNKLVGGQDPDFQTSEESGQVAAGGIYAYCDAIADERRAIPRDDIMTALVEAEIDGDRMSKQELNMFFVLLCVAGNETTRNLISHTMLALIEHPDARADLVANIDDDALWATATEEFLRWGGSIHNFRRTATCDTEIGGHAIAEGDKVVIYYLAANRDEDRVRGPVPLRHPSHPQRAPDVRRWRYAFLSRRQPRPGRDPV